MATEKKPKNRQGEYERQKARRAAKAAVAANEEAASTEDPKETAIRIQLELLERRTKNRPTDADGDIDFAYRNMAIADVEPLLAPSLAAYSWYCFARSEPNEFLKITQKREDAKAKQAGTITNQRMEDDKRKQFAILDRIEKQLTLDVNETVDDLMSKFPDDVLLRCRKHKAAWNAFFEKYPLDGPEKR